MKCFLFFKVEAEDVGNSFNAASSDLTVIKVNCVRTCTASSLVIHCINDLDTLYYI